MSIGNVSIVSLKEYLKISKMTAEILFGVIIAILVVNFLINKYLDIINAKHFDDEIPQELKDVYDEERYLKSQQYKKESFKFSMLTSIVSFIATIAFFYLDGFAYVDDLARSFSSNEIIITLLFFGIIMLANDLLTTPLSYYQTFVIEEKYGFNKSTKKLFFLDKLKGWLLTIILGGGILTLIVWFYQATGKNLHGINFREPTTYRIIRTN